MAYCEISIQQLHLTLFNVEFYTTFATQFQTFRLCTEDTSPEEDHTVSSASLCMSPAVTSEPRPEPLCASTPYARERTPTANGHDRVDNAHCDFINGNAHVNIISESTNSMDVLSGGESDAGDTLSRRNNNSITSSMLGTLKESTTELPRRRNCDITYFVAKELLMTERTYKRDLELVTVTWSQKVSELASEDVDEVSTLARTCLALEPVALSSGALLARLERALSSKTNDNEEPEYKKIAEILYEHLLATADAYTSYIAMAGALVAVHESVRRRVRRVCAASAALEAAAPAPVAAALARPLHRALHLHALANELCEGGVKGAALKALELSAELSRSALAELPHVEGHITLCQLQRDILGYDKLLVADREFIRMGCLYKHSSKGLQQRMLFLFNDIAVLCSRSEARFRATRVTPLADVTLHKHSLPHSFALQGPEDESILLTASNERQFASWWSALEAAVAGARGRGRAVDTELTAGEHQHESSVASSGAGAGGAAHVCWHRVTAVSAALLHTAMRTQLSGYLLRKFKKSPGWQKLWVSVSLAALYFYKAAADAAPLASLPLLGYSVGAPAPEDGIDKEFVFKLQFKNHVYFFRADSHYTYSRWTEVLRTVMTDSNHDRH